MEIKIINPGEKPLPPVEWNYQELKTELSNQMQKYQGLVYDDTQIKKAKEDRARLNKFQKACEDRRKDLKAYYLAPYNAFEEQYKDLMTVVQAPCYLIDKQVKEFEEKGKAEKLEQIENIWNENIGELDNLVSFDKVYDLKWLNVGVSIKNIEKEIIERIVKIKSDLNIIDTIETKHKVAMKKAYFDSLDIGKAIEDKNRLEEQEKRQNEYEAKIKEQAADVSPESTNSTKEAPKIDKMIEVVLKIAGTVQQLSELKKYMDENEIKYEKTGGK
jgi:hypothetical protein